MKICLVSDTLPGYHETWSGAELVCWRLGELLQKEGHKVFFITSPFKKENVSENKRVFQIPTPLDKLSKFIPFFPSFSTHFPIDFYSILCSFILLKKIKPDVIHFHSKKFFLPAMVANLIFKIPTVFTVLDYFIICPVSNLLKPHNQICREFQGINCFQCIPATKHPLKRAVQKITPIQIRKKFPLWRSKIFNCFLEKLDTVITLTKTSKARLEQRGLPSEKIKVIYYQLDPKINKIKSNPNSYKVPTMLFVGSLFPHKGLQVLIRALPYVISKIPKTKLIAVGIGDKLYRTKIEGLINDLRIGEYIEFLGHLKNEEVLELIQKSDLVVVPEQWPSDFGPVILLEAMALGKPVVASKIGSAPEFVKDGLNGFLVDHNQPEQFAEKITWLLKNKTSAQSMGEKAKESVQFLFNGSQEKEIVTLYKNLIKNANRD